MTLVTRRRAGIAVAVLAFAGVAGWWWWPAADRSESAGAAEPPDGWAVYAGASFGAEPLVPDVTPPTARLVRVPDFPGAFAVWGAVGRDAAGRVWVSAASHFVPTQSARLFEYDPASDTMTPRGDALAQLKAANLYRPGEQQPKIHTKFVPGADGCLYFASTDDPPPGAAADRAPRWGAHLWRVRPGAEAWEHLKAFDEGLIALAGEGKLMYALAYPDHVLVQYDCATGAVRRVTVGSVEGHISRHLLCDHRGHAYVPRLRYTRPGHADHTLVEFDPDLREVAEHPLPHYQFGDAGQCHGIIAYQPLADGSIAFTTHAGRLFRLEVPARGPSRLGDLGWFHPAGQSYASGLFTFAGERYLVGAAQAAGKWEWVCFDLETRKSRTLPLRLPAPPGWSAADAFLYGCTTRDDLGDFYLAGAFRDPKSQRVPVVVRLTVAAK